MTVNKKKLLVSFSGGETSAYMAQWLWNNKRDEYEMIFVFANTGEESEETLLFVERCSHYFSFPVVWVESVFHKERGVGTTHSVVNYKTASRKGEPFENNIKTYGIPNIANPQCTRELKRVPIQKYAKSIGWKKYYTAIGIRVDEIDRVDSKRVQKRLYYPLCQDHPKTKPEINVYWKNMPFRLDLKGYQGNCKWCWKKSFKKLRRIAKDNPEHFDFPLKMEEKYGNYMPDHRIEKWIEQGKEVPTSITFFRGNKSAKNILEEAKNADPKVFDDSRNYNIQSSLLNNDDLNESCEVFAECGPENI